MIFNLTFSSFVISFDKNFFKNHFMHEILIVCYFFYAQDHISKKHVNASQENKKQMKNILRNRMALSTVVTTLIILVVSVLLAGVVSYFAINVTSTRVQEESLQLTSQHIWVDQHGDSRRVQ